MSGFFYADLCNYLAGNYVVTSYRSRKTGASIADIRA